MTIEEYWKMYIKYSKREISETEWSTYCMEVLKDLMTENQDVLERLKR